MGNQINYIQAEKNFGMISRLKDRDATPSLCPTVVKKLESGSAIINLFCQHT